LQMGPFIAATQDRRWRLRDDADDRGKLPGQSLAHILPRLQPRQSDRFFLGMLSWVAGQRTSRKITRCATRRRPRCCFPHLQENTRVLSWLLQIRKAICPIPSLNSSGSSNTWESAKRSSSKQQTPLATRCWRGYRQLKYFISPGTRFFRIDDPFQSCLGLAPPDILSLEDLQPLLLQNPPRMVILSACQTWNGSGNYAG
jgi:hypothetical protein